MIGSLVASFYGSRVADAASGLPSGAQGAVKDSIGSADAVAAQLPADQGASLQPCRRDRVHRRAGPRAVRGRGRRASSPP